ncbi:DNA-processing protein DprA, partial [Ruminococcaceae bacterium OttesenSCG-928-A11]|nr:DNA-processing protein DprA [Ruminococcaceae bacterium OttesenSCG-928-A11]
MANELWYWLASGLGWGAVNSGELLAACPGGPEAVYRQLGSDLLDDLLTQKQAEKLAATRPEDFALPLAHCEASGVAVIGYDDPRYPAALRTITNPPLVLFVKGDTTLLNGQLSIGMVGARRPSAYGVEAVKAIGRGVAMGGAIIISGLAAGLDTEAHKAALAVNGPTIACVAFGHDHCYPAANKKLMEVIERHGAVVSEYPLATSPEKPYFLQRNRLIAGMSHGLVVVEARKHSGTMSTVNYAADFGRDVFAVPGSIFSELSGGTNA